MRRTARIRILAVAIFALLAWNGGAAQAGPLLFSTPAGSVDSDNEPVSQRASLS